MKKILFVLFVWSLAFPIANTASSAVCVCPKIAMYPVGATNWFHYALVCNTSPTGCKDDYPTGYTGPKQQGLSCAGSSNSCVNCIDLGGVASAKISLESAASGEFELYIGDPKNNAAAYEELDTEDKMKAYFRAYAPREADTGLYDRYKFTPAFAQSYEKPFVVVLNRKVGSVCEEFYAIIWQVQATEPAATGYLGVEIFGPLPNGVKVLKPCQVCNAVVTKSDGAGGVQHTPVPGLLQVQFSSYKYDVAFVRLHDSDKNRNAGYKPCKP